MEDLALILKEAGVVGAGGAGFPTYAKLKRDGIKVYIANGVECEPLLWTNKELLLNAPHMVIEGFKLLVDFVGAERGIIALKGKYKEILDLIAKTVREYGYNFEIFAGSDHYPLGDEHVLVYESVGRVVPAGGIPLMVGAIVNNVETIYNVYRAVVERKPVIEKLVTVGGDVGDPVTVMVPIGMKFKEILSALNIDYEGKVLIEGGVMTGKIVSPEDPVTKTTGGLLLFKEGHPAIARMSAPISYILKRARTCCIQCRYCTDQCPRYLLGHDLEPHKIMMSMAFDMGMSVRKSALLCSECGVCEAYSCPQGLSPKRVNQYLKAKLSQEGIKYTPQPNVAPRIDRDYRKVPTQRLMDRIDIKRFDKKAPLIKEKLRADEVTILMKQHIGVPAVPVVSVGDHVEEGEVIAKVPEGSLGANVHASISGKVEFVSNALVVLRRERNNHG